jgi:hypothetical protein
MRKSATDTEADFQISVTRVLSEVGNFSYRAATQRLRGIEADYLNRAKNDTERLAIRQFVAQVVLDVAIQKKCPLQTTRKRFKEACDLGFPLINSKATAYIILAEYCAGLGHTEESVELLEDMREELAEIAKQDRSAGIRRQIATVDDWLKRFRESQTKGPFS